VWHSVCEGVFPGSAEEVWTLGLFGRPRSALGQMSLLLAVCLAVFLVVAPIAVWRLGESGVAVAFTAALCCLLPGCLLFVLWNSGLSSSLQLPLVLLGMVIRVGCCFLGVVVTRAMWDVPADAVLLVAVVFYSATLACETWLMMGPVSLKGVRSSQTLELQTLDPTGPAAFVSDDLVD
jgi:hypothetical protein